MNRIVRDLTKLSLKDDEFDAISFFKSNEGWKFLIVKYHKAQDYEKTEMGYKYYMFHIDKRLGNVAIVEEAILGDPLYVISNYTKANCEGVFAKKCMTSEEILKKLVGQDLDFAKFKKIVKTEGEEV